MSNNNITYRPHDALFKGVFGHKKEATELLKSHLPPEVLAKVDLSNIEIVKSEFIRENLLDKHSDLVIKTNIEGKEGYIYTLLEHQSTPDKNIFFRLMEYNSLLMQQHLKDGNKTLPSIYNMVIYAGKKTYNVATSMLELADHPPTFAHNLTYQLINLVNEPDDKLLKNGSIAFAELVLKHSIHKQFCKWIEQNMITFRALALNCHYLNEVLYYLNQVEDDEGCNLPQKLIKLVPSIKDKVMTVATRLRQEGKREGEKSIVAKMISKGLLSKTQAEQLLKEK